MSILSRFRRPTPPDDFAEMADLYPPAVLPPPCPAVEPEDLAVLVAAMDAPSLVDYVPSSHSFTGVDISNENRVLDCLAALTCEVSPLEAARVLFGGPRA